MAGTSQGAKLAAKKNIEREPGFYPRIGKIGGQRSKNGGFGSELVGKDGLTGRERARKFGSIGGRMSKRKKQ